MKAIYKLESLSFWNYGGEFSKKICMYVCKIMDELKFSKLELMHTPKLVIFLQSPAVSRALFSPVTKIGLIISFVYSIHYGYIKAWYYS